MYIRMYVCMYKYIFSEVLIASGVLQRKKEPPEAASKEATQKKGQTQEKSGARGKQQIADTGGDKKKEDAKQKKDKKKDHKRKSDSGGGGGGEVARQVACSVLSLLALKVQILTAEELEKWHGRWPALHSVYLLYWYKSTNTDT
jgi:hypothetical protein